ncbi:hypothetical protein WJX77_005242 [Trebouxia sp. C0004]
MTNLAKRLAVHSAESAKGGIYGLGVDTNALALQQKFCFVGDCADSISASVAFARRLCYTVRSARLAKLRAAATAKTGNALAETSVPVVLSASATVATPSKSRTGSEARDTAMLQE